MNLWKVCLKSTLATAEGLANEEKKKKEEIGGKEGRWAEEERKLNATSEGYRDGLVRLSIRVCTCLRVFLFSWLRDG